MGSTISPSETRMVRTRRGAIMWRSSGTMTVGPVTVTMAPNSAAAPNDRPVRT